MTAAVLDASVFVAAITPREPRHAQARALYQAQPADEPWFVPSLFRIEVLAALARRGEDRQLLDTVNAMIGGPRFRSIPVVDEVLDLAASVAISARVRGYDAIYASVALLRDATLVTLDDELAERLSVAYPKLAILSATRDRQPTPAPPTE